MTIMQRLSSWAEGLPVPDAVSRMVIASLIGSTDRSLGAAPPDVATFVREMASFPIAVHTDAANAQHYEVPAAFFEAILGSQRKYSCCYYADARDTLNTAEETALTLTAEHADLADGQAILELGCGWGSLSLWMATHYPKARIVSVSNSASQRAFIEAEAERRQLTNLDVVTADMNDFATDERFDRVVSVEMFEHMANWHTLLGRIHGWLKPDGRLLIHVFAHIEGCYRFDATDAGDWIAQHFFTGGLMPSAALAHQFPDLFAVEAEWRWSGTHYQATAEHWLANFDRNRATIDPILRTVYGPAAPLWRRRWRLFFLATSGLFGHADGEAWGVHHYRLRAA
ncbi:MULTISPECIES: cyclopropane-fatty-acyl-phospholipid synthase family protein [unclassified Chelatococcus]|uniref:SAM-dependent methyltransferase n=1 Tax=unclassified Chelatococcus TaxID=2638111 RepID=UPI001BCD787D|nr:MULTISPECIES: cyclopropane-fatty-acyl-phospholipid synthase family protein [unclassified Chelatococcus]CAH1655762.1 Cyclopropane-fatty-acyl-phospholipid synthase [Hyphomicrobiales bacterium]MBS7742560.1 class I SAM-dependent methyltransferase [Chelatococcus sp. HY11]MBX3542322.1 class I SAM-dependent methyltransferase [Chelatococcus sp.]MCO5075460.1 cyclopropane-fatty-acyl-phospholipid synthase family protein [Chelatococcus sp.]CAH1695627.1 Cyclopropane-fatty-acyl-phospholipid synthase [Hyp